MCFDFIGQEAKRVFDDAQVMLKKIIADQLLKAHGVVGIFQARQCGDDIEVLDSSGYVIGILHGLRQQVSQVSSNMQLMFI